MYAVQHIDRLLTEAGIPFGSVSSPHSLESSDITGVRIDYAPEATAEQRAAGQAILDAFDPVVVARSARVAALRRESTARVEALGITIYDQINALRGRLTTDRVTAIDAAVTSARADFLAAKASVNAASTIEEVEAVDL